VATAWTGASLLGHRGAGSSARLLFQRFEDRDSAFEPRSRRDVIVVRVLSTVGSPVGLFVAGVLDEVDCLERGQVPVMEVYRRNRPSASGLDPEGEGRKIG